MKTYREDEPDTTDDDDVIDDVWLRNCDVVKAETDRPRNPIHVGRQGRGRGIFVLPPRKNTYTHIWHGGSARM